MTLITTHVLDTAAGKPAAGLRVTLAAHAAGAWPTVEDAVTDSDGRVKDFAPVGPGLYRLTFVTGTPFFPRVAVEFVVTDEPHLHVPLLLSPYGYSVYRGS